MNKSIFFAFACLIALPVFAQQDARYREFTKTYKTYPFSDPDPIPAPAKLYPYFRFDGFTDEAVEKPWKVVLLENDYIEVQIMPEIGGKVWTAIDKKTGKPFLYDNDVVKFRDIAMRGPWVSGGIEPNYGVIGHTPNTATPVDYLLEKGEDGSVSCFVSTLDLLTRTRWILEIRLEKDKAYFTTHSYWFNSTGIEQPYYTWMNAGIPAGEDLQFLYPGTHYIGHGGEAAPWPLDTAGRDLSYYKENDFGSSKSYHVLGSHSKYFGARWSNDDFGMIHYAPREDKLGKKIFLWAQSRSGGIWEDLLTDDAGQYVEIQSGRLFNQNQFASSATPFKQIGFEPYTSDTWTEYWYPFSDMQGFSAANKIGAFTIHQDAQELQVRISPVQPLNDSLKVWDSSGTPLAAALVQAEPREMVDTRIVLPENAQAARISIKGEILDLNDTMPGDALSRPVVTESEEETHDDSAYGLYVQGRDLANFRNFTEAEEKIHKSLNKNSNLVPALSQMARLKLFRMQFDSAFYYSKKALAIDTYDGASNYYYGKAAEALGQYTDALDGYEVASLTPFFRGAAYTALARLYIKKDDALHAKVYVEKALDNQASNLEAWRLQYVLGRQQGDAETMQEARAAILEKNPLSHFLRFEAYLQDKSEASRQAFTDLIRNEMPVETYLELGSWYANLGLNDQAIAVLEMAPENPEVFTWLAWLYRDEDAKRSEQYLKQMQQADARLVFPFRQESAVVFAWASEQVSSWKPDYFLALIQQYRGNSEEAKTLLEQHDKVDFAPYYLLRARLTDNQDQQLTDLHHAVKSDPDQWRYGMLLSRALHQQGKGQEAIDILEKYYKQQPENYILGLDYVRLLIDQSDYQKSEEVLNHLHILPFEGATDARNYYRKTKLMLAQQALEKKQFDQALQKIQEAEEWPEQLGVGKPYDNMIDNSIEQIMRNQIHELSGKGQVVQTDAIKDPKITAENYLEAIENLTSRTDERLF